MSFGPEEKFGIKLPDTEVWESAWEFVRILSHGYRNSKKAKFDDTILTKKLIADSYNNCIWDIYSILQWGHDKTIDKPSQKIQFSCPEQELSAKNVRGVMGLSCELDPNEKIPFSEIKEQFDKIKEHFDFRKNFYISCPSTRNECDDEYVRKAYFENCGSFTGDENGLTEAEESKIRDDIRELKQEFENFLNELQSRFLEANNSEIDRYNSLKLEIETEIEETTARLDEIAGEIQNPDIIGDLNEILHTVQDEKLLFQDFMASQRSLLQEKFTEELGSITSNTNDQRDNVLSVLLSNKNDKIEKIDNIIENLQSLIDEAPNGVDVSGFETLINGYENIKSQYNSSYVIKVSQTQSQYSDLLVSRVDKAEVDFSNDLKKFDERLENEIITRDERIEKTIEVIDYFTSVFNTNYPDYTEAISILQDFKQEIRTADNNYSSTISDMRSNIILEQNLILDRVISSLNGYKNREKSDITEQINSEISELLSEIEELEENIGELNPDPTDLSLYKDINTGINLDFDNVNSDIETLKNSLAPGEVSDSLQSFIDTNNDRKAQLITENSVLDNMIGGFFNSTLFPNMCSVNENIIDILVVEISDIQNIIINLENSESPDPYNGIKDQLADIIEKIRNKLTSYLNTKYNLDSTPYEEIIALNREKIILLQYLLSEKINYIETNYSSEIENRIQALRIQFALEIEEFDIRFSNQNDIRGTNLEEIEEGIQHIKILKEISSLQILLVSSQTKLTEIDETHKRNLDGILVDYEKEKKKESLKYEALIFALEVELDNKLKVEIIIKKMFEKMNAECLYSDEGGELPEYSDDDCPDKINPTEEEVAAQFDRESDNGVFYDQTPPVVWKKKLKESEVKITEDDILFDDDVDAYKSECEVQTPNGGKVNVECGHTFLIYNLPDKDAYIEHH